MFSRLSSRKFGRLILRPQYQALVKGQTRLSSLETRQWSTPLARNIAQVIETTGPIPLASYMRQCLTSPEGGYYTQRRNGADPFGQQGDFITSPEISQIFGELIALWFVAEWISQGRKSSGIELIEVGPGRGTLMDDMLRTLRNFKPFASSVEAVYMIEASEPLREAQRKLLCGSTPMEETAEGYRCISKYSQIPIIWRDDIRQVPKRIEKTPFIVAHEFFDALPIYAFESVSQSESPVSNLTLPSTAQIPKRSAAPQWRELLVTATPLGSTHTTLSTPTSQRSTGDAPEFQLVQSNASTPMSLYLPEISERYKALKKRRGSIIEICPEGHSYAEEFASRIGGDGKAPGKKTPSGAAIIVDYGPASTVPINSLRGIRSHKSVSPFSSPGQVDLSADVDFVALAEAALKASPGVEVYGPVEQGYFLQSMGINERTSQLVNSVPPSEDEKRNRIETGAKRLTDRGVGGMGKVYKAMAIVPISDGTRRPVGFGGDIKTT